MREYLIVAAAFTALGIFIFVVYRRYVRLLLSLAETHDLERRRQIASRWRLVVGLSVVVAAGSTQLALLSYTKVPNVVIGSGFVLSVLPGFVWFVRRWAKLRELGYPH